MTTPAVQVALGQQAQKSPSGWARGLKRVSSATSIIALAIGVWIKWEQSAIEERQKQLDQRIKTQQLTGDFADKVFGHLNDLGIADAKHREGIVIDLLDLVTQAAVSETGKAQGTVERQRSLPLRLALLTGNDESLADLGGDPARLQVWMAYAKQSGNADVKATALRALDHLCRANGATLSGNAARQTVLHYLGDLRELSNDLRTDAVPVRKAALGALQTLVGVMARDPLAYRGSDGLEAVRTALTSLIGSSARGGDEALSAGRASATDPSVASDATLIFKSLTESGLLREPIAQARPVLVPGDPSPPGSTPPSPTAGQPTPLDVLVDALGTVAPDGRAAAALSLYNFSQRSRLTGTARAEVLVTALGDRDPATRKYVAEFLMRLHDRETVSAVWAAMKPVLVTPQPDNRLYNSAVVCATWARVLPSGLDDLRTRMREALAKLRGQIRNDKDYRRTMALLTEVGAGD